jgi:diguanylate cyclase (GGDEF)-like protein
MKNSSANISILYIEDEEEIRDSLSRFINRFSKKLYIAKDGEEGLALYKEYNPDIVISDIKMPKMNGIEMSKYIKDINPEQPIIFTTAHSESSFFMEAIEMQVDGYILKPINLKLLKSKIESISKIIQLQNDLKKQQLLIQEVSSFQDNILILLDSEEKLLFTNQKFLEFFASSSINEFNEMYNCLCDIFVDHKDFFYPGSIDWIRELEILEDDKRVVSMLDRVSGIPKAFVVNVKRIAKTKHTIITFSEVTNLAIKKREFETKAYRDELTGIYNRAKFNEELVTDIEIYHKDITPLSIIMFDIDHFKKFNDDYGHHVGDEVLIELSQIVLKKVRKTDLFARWGGEEFVMLLQNTCIGGAKQLAESLRVTIENNLFKNSLKVTCSFGVAEFSSDDNEKSFLKRVDEALYRAKDNGRNRVES